MVFAVFKRSRYNRRKFLESHEYHKLVSAAAAHDELLSSTVVIPQQVSIFTSIAHYRIPVIGAVSVQTVQVSCGVTRSSGCVLQRRHA